MEELAIGTGPDLIDGLSKSRCQPKLTDGCLWRLTYRRVEVNEDGAGNIFTAADLGEEGLVGTTRADFVGDTGVVTAVGLETVLEQVPILIRLISSWDQSALTSGEETYSSHAALPSCIPAWPMWM